MQIRHGGPGPGARVSLTGTVIVSAALLASGCSSASSSPPAAASGSGSPAVSSGSPAPVSSAPAASPSASGPAAPVTPASSATSSPSVNPGGPETQTCAQKATRAFIHLTKVAVAANGGLTVTGNKTTLVCGGPDDFHFNVVVSSTETGTVLPGADIEVFPVTKMAQEKIAASKLAAYLAADDDTKIFLIGGSLSAITSLVEQFHP